MIAITMGDPAGVGPEVVVRAHLSDPGRPGGKVCVGDPEALRQAAQMLGKKLTLAQVEDPHDAKRFKRGVLAVLPTRARCNWKGFAWGHPDPANAAAVVESIETAARLCLSGVCQAMVTPPINKAVLHAGGFDLPGHTELLGRLTGQQPLMMLVGKKLRVVPATVHQSLRSVPDALTVDGLLTLMGGVRKGLQRDFGLPDPRIALAALNPHGGEGGAFGREEIEVLTPACEEMRSRGWLVEGPLAADTLFHRKARKRFDAVVCGYHDQALIPIKTIAFGSAVNVTLGLPVVRTSVDHGTGFDIAGSGQARARSFENALQLAGRIAINRRRFDSKGQR